MIHLKKQPAYLIIIFYFFKYIVFMLISKKKENISLYIWNYDFFYNSEKDFFFSILVGSCSESEDKK